MGTYYHNLDLKNRIAVPSKYQNLGETFVVHRPLTGKKHLSIYRFDDWVELVELARSKEEDLQKQGYIQEVYNSNAFLVTKDKQGRITFDKRFCEYAGLEKEVVFVGVGRHINVWDRTAYEEKIRTDEEQIISGQMPEGFAPPF
ncbi:MAG TPA: hypothetical protein PKW24_02865 [Clostridiales bacterium]|nr:hypothetical protein [Clostridiales bacterium]